jgi:hypothetical protein
MPQAPDCQGGQRVRHTVGKTSPPAQFPLIFDNSESLCYITRNIIVTNETFKVTFCKKNRNSLRKYHEGRVKAGISDLAFNVSITEQVRLSIV